MLTSDQILNTKVLIASIFIVLALLAVWEVPSTGKELCLLQSAREVVKCSAAPTSKRRHQLLEVTEGLWLLVEILGMLMALLCLLETVKHQPKAAEVARVVQSVELTPGLETGDK
jgi:uncharacterized membrane protein YozB (DUF420 family)